MMSVLHRIVLLLSAASLCFLLDSCSSSSSLRGVPRNLPPINLHGSAQTPPHSMEKKDYPFDANGNYVTSWAALAGAPANDSDFDSWRSSHGEGRRSRKQPSSVKKYTGSSSSKKGSSSSSSSTKKKGSSGAAKSKSGSSSGSGSGSGSKSKSGSSGGGGHVVKPGDSLSSIARKYNTSVSKLKAANGLDSDMIRDGKSLKIPKK